MQSTMPSKAVHLALVPLPLTFAPEAVHLALVPLPLTYAPEAVHLALVPLLLEHASTLELGPSRFPVKQQHSWMVK